jgi:hypothetical protein
LRVTAHGPELATRDQGKIANAIKSTALALVAASTLGRYWLDSPKDTNGGCWSESSTRFKMENEQTTESIVPCRLCGATGEIVNATTGPTRWTVLCPRRKHKRGSRAANDVACANTLQNWRTTQEAAVAAWNWKNDPSYVPKPRNKRNYDEKRDIDSAGPRCPRCNLLITNSDGECIDCPGRKDAVAELAGTRIGEQRTSSIMPGGPR